jgi:hypothetical protein
LIAADHGLQWVRFGPTYGRFGPISCICFFRRHLIFFFRYSEGGQSVTYFFFRSIAN